MVHRRQRETHGDLLPSAILGLLGTRGPTSRADLARLLGTSPATVTQITKGLLARGLVRELDQQSTGGRPGRTLGLVRTAGRAIGVKVAAEHAVIVEAELDGTVAAKTTFKYDTTAPDAIDRLAHHLRAAVAAATGPVLGVGIGIPGTVDSQASGIVEAPTMGWRDAHVGPILRSSLGLPVLVENDVNTLAVAEQLYGTGRRHSSYLIVTIGRGIGCGIVIDGELYRGAQGGAGEIGHIPVRDDDTVCGCGSTGCLEAYVCESALVSQAVQRGAIAATATTGDLLDAARAGNTDAQDIYAEAGTLLGRALAGVVHTVDPEIVILLGEGIDAWPYWLVGFEASFRRCLLPRQRGLPIEVDAWADDKWALGAASLVLATSFDATGTSGDQGQAVRRRLHEAAASAVTS